MANILFLYCIVLIVFATEWLQAVGFIGLILGYLALRLENFKLRYGITPQRDPREELMRRLP